MTTCGFWVVAAESNSRVDGHGWIVGKWENLDENFMIHTTTHRDN